MLDHVIAKAIRTPWAITPEYGAIVFDVLRARASGLRLSDEEIQRRIEAQTGRQAASARAEPRTDGVIAVIPIHGVICNRSFEASSGSTSAEFIARAVRQADADPGVKALLFDVSSPGGVVLGIPETAKVIRSCTKPTVAFIDALSASAGYWLTAQCDEIVMRESAEAGSVGVYALSEDWSVWLEKEGIKINAISAGEYKLEGAPWEPLSDEGRAYIQAQVDDTYAKFLQAVAAGRGTSVADVRKNYGRGRCLSAPAAKAAGMVDRIGELDVAIARANALAKAGRSGAQARRVEPLPDPIAAAVAPTAESGAAGALHPETYMGDPNGQVPVAQGIQPRADGTCPDGYEQGEDGLCYLPGETEDPEDDAQARRRQAQADRDAIEVARA
ncbi:MAG: S49 family peptidase [Vicinamibacterales bacterium]